MFLRYAFLILLAACSGAVSHPEVVNSSNETSDAVTSPLPIFTSGAMQGHWQQGGWSWGSVSSAIASSKINVSSEASGAGFAITSTNNDGTVLNVAVAGYTALSFDISSPAALTVKVSTGSGYNSGVDGASMAVSSSATGAKCTNAANGAMTHVVCPLATLKGSLTQFFEIVFSTSSTVSYSLANVQLDVAAALTAPSASLVASPTNIISGASSTLTWTSANASAVTLNGAAVALNGSQVVSPTTATSATVTYTLVATGAAGTTAATKTAQVTVTAPVGNPAQPVPPAGSTLIYGDAFGANWQDWSWGKLSGEVDQSTVAMGTKALQETFNDTSVTSPGVKLAHVDAPGNQTAISSASFSKVVLYVKGANVAGLGMGFDGGNFFAVGAHASAAASGWTRIDVAASEIGASFSSIVLYNLAAGSTYYVDAVWLEPAAAPPAAPTASLAASLTTITSGQSSTLTWSSTNATAVTLTTPAGTTAVASSGTQAVSPTSTATYTLVATGAAGTTAATKTATIVVNAAGGVVTPVDPGAASYTATVDTTTGRQAISPLIYGINNYSDTTGGDPKNLTVDRLGGDRINSYNWVINAANSGGMDLSTSNFYQNSGEDGSGPAGMVTHHVDQNRTRNTATMMLLQFGDYVAGQTSGQTQDDVAGYLNTFKRAAISSNVDITTAPANPSASASTVYMDQFVNWVHWHYSSLSDLFTSSNKRLIVCLDNEPDLMYEAFPILQAGQANVSLVTMLNTPATSTTGYHLNSNLSFLNNTQFPTTASGFPDGVVRSIGHRVTAQEMIARELNMIRMLRRVVPQAEVMGPDSYGWDGMRSFNDTWPQSSWPDQAKPYDDNFWYADDYLQHMAAESLAEGQKAISAFDLHWYPEVTSGGTRLTYINNATGAAADAIMQNPRSFWDPSYVESSWVADGAGAINLINRMKAKITAAFSAANVQAYTPGLAIMEYYLGGGGSIAGGVAEADLLGVFAKFGVYAGGLWKWSGGSLAYTFGGMSMFRNFDGANGSFGDTYVNTSFSNTAVGSAYASVDASSNNRVVVVLVNKQSTAQTSAVKVTHAVQLNTVHVYTLTSANSSPVKQADRATTTRNALLYTMPAQSVTTLVFAP